MFLQRLAYRNCQEKDIFKLALANYNILFTQLAVGFYVNHFYIHSNKK